MTRAGSEVENDKYSPQNTTALLHMVIRAGSSRPNLRTRNQHREAGLSEAARTFLVSSN